MPPPYLMPPPYMGAMPPPFPFDAGMLPPGMPAAGGRAQRARFAAAAAGGKQYVPRDPDADAKWNHDMYQEGPPPRRGQRTRLAAAGATMGLASRGSAPSLTKLRVTNLHHDVSEQDINELFSTVGPLVR